MADTKHDMDAGTTHAMKATPGTVITARPWAKGKPLSRAVRGIVLDTWNGDSGDVLVWFPTHGRPIDLGTAVQPILAGEIRTVDDLAACSRRWVADVVYALAACKFWDAMPPADRDAFIDLISACYVTHYPA